MFPDGHSYCLYRYIVRLVHTRHLSERLVSKFYPVRQVLSTSSLFVGMYDTTELKEHEKK